jgi:oxygen-independent coproporphyrinogen-3 oxidase
MTSLYVHIPFCLSKCAYCDFLSFDGRSAREISRYLRCLARETAMFGGEVCSLYIGGGTPTRLSRRELEDVLGKLRSWYRFGEGAEFTVEANPESLTRSHLSLFKEHGVNRISLGVQSFDERALAAAGRAAGRREIFRALERIRRAGFANFGIDLILGIQGRESFRGDLETAVAEGPSHVSVYLLTLSPRTRLADMARSGAFAMPGDDECEELFLFAGEYLGGHGFRRYEISNYAKPGRESAHNAHYWRGGDYRGLGLGAVSTFGARRTTNARTLEGYCGMLERGEPPVCEVEHLSDADRALERIMLALRTAAGIERDDLERVAGEERGGDLRAFLTMLERNGYCAVGGNRLVLTPKGLFRSNAVVAELWETLGGVF